MDTATKNASRVGAVLFMAGFATMGCEHELAELYRQLQGGTERDATLADESSSSQACEEGACPLRVAADASEGGDGMSWDTAYADLQAAVDAQAEAGGGEVWVARGRYVAADGASQVLRVREGVDIYGGFAGTETSLDERDLSEGLSRLDAAGATHVAVVQAPAGRLDGFELIGGSAQGTGADAFGGGLYIQGATSSFVVAGCRVHGNTAFERGGGVYIEDGSPRIEDTTITGNTSYGEGGGVYQLRSDVELTGVTISDNDANRGAAGMVNRASHVVMREGAIEANYSYWDREAGGVSNREQSTFMVEGTHFSANAVELGDGGDIFNAAGSVVQLTGSHLEGGRAEAYGGSVFNAGTLTIRDTMLVGAEAAEGGALYNAAGGDAEIVNSTFAANTAYYPSYGGIGGAVYTAGRLVMTNVTLVDNAEQSCSAEVCADGVVTADGGSSTLVNIASWGDDVAAHEGATSSVSHSCMLPEGDTSYDAVDSDDDGHVEYYIGANSTCIDVGSSAAAEEAGLAWAELTTQALGCLDSGPADPGHHHASSAVQPAPCSDAPVAASRL